MDSPVDVAPGVFLFQHPEDAGDVIITNSFGLVQWKLNHPWFTRCSVLESSWINISVDSNKKTSPPVSSTNFRYVTNPIHSKRCILKLFVILTASTGLHTYLKLSTCFCALLDLSFGFSKSLKTDNNNNNKTAIIKTVTLRWLLLWLHWAIYTVTYSIVIVITHFTSFYCNACYSVT